MSKINHRKTFVKTFSSQFPIFELGTFYQHNGNTADACYGFEVNLESEKNLLKFLAKSARAKKYAE